MSRRTVDYFRQKLKRWGLLPVVPIDFIRPTHQQGDTKTSVENAVVGTVATETTTDIITVPATGTFEWRVYAVLHGSVVSDKSAVVNTTASVTNNIRADIAGGGMAQVAGATLQYNVTAGLPGAIEQVIGQATAIFSVAATNSATYQFQILPAIAGGGTLNADGSAGVNRRHSIEVQLLRTA